MAEEPLTYQFDDVRVEPRSFKVFKAGAAVPLEPKGFEVLLFLIENRGRLIEKEELLDAVWRDAFVTPNAMTRVIAHLRKALGDDAKEGRYIETVPKRGYRFIAAVEAQGMGGAGNGKTALKVEGVAESRAGALPAAAVTTAAHPAATVTEQTRRRPSLSVIALCGVCLLLLTVAAVLWRGNAKPAAAERTGVSQATQITSWSGLDIYPALSPDGNSIAYSSDRGGRFEVYVRQLAPGGREIQITADGAENFQPAWSPDGKLIAYYSRGRGGIWVVPALGGVARQLTQFGSRPAWSRDGSLVAFQSDGITDLSQAAFGAMPPSTIWTVAAGGGAPRQVTQLGDPPGGHGSPSWSPDGRRLVFVTYDIGLSAIWSVAAAGGDLKRVVGDHAVYHSPVYLPDGGSIYYATAGGNFRLWRVRLAPGGEPAGEAVEVANTGAALFKHLTVGPDGKRIAYSAQTMTNNLASVPIAAGTYEAAGPPALLTQDTNYRKTAQVFSPDGRKLAYSVWRMGAEGEIWVMDVDGKNARQVTTEPSALLGWLPEGEQVVFVSKGSSGRLVSVTDLRTGKQRPLTEFRSDIRMGRLSPDAKQIAFNYRAEGTINVWTAPLEGGPVRQLTSDRELAGFPAWSPDGKSLALEVKRGEDTHIVVMPSGGGPFVQLTAERGQSWPGSWSPDGDKVVFAGLRNGYWNIWWVSRRTRAVEQVTDYTKPNAYVRYPSWSPLGNQIVYEYAETTGNIWVMDLK